MMRLPEPDGLTDEQEFPCARNFPLPKTGQGRSPLEPLRQPRQSTFLAFTDAVSCCATVAPGAAAAPGYSRPSWLQQNRVESTVVVLFGSARFKAPDVAEAILRDAAATTGGDRARRQMEERALLVRSAPLRQLVHAQSGRSASQ